jgi:hypothetical protein
VVLPLSQVRSVNPSASTRNRSERYIQVATMDNHEFWFVGFVNYDKALKNLYEALQHHDVHGHHRSGLRFCLILLLQCNSFMFMMICETGFTILN